MITVDPGPVLQKDVEFVEENEDDDSGDTLDDFDFGDTEVEEVVEEASTNEPGARLLNQLLGQELLNVHISINMLLTLTEGGDSKTSATQRAAVNNG